MRLTKLKLAGFKSFVDPTVFNIVGNVVAVVGPNGCGKSNIIDAARWVMGESAARQLRGDSMEDVIFNGSSSRKPVGQASVELVFDNSLGKLAGPWGHYSEISVKRLVNRGGQSHYYLNGARCRRRDISDIFLGTGLGPRSYAIIEQGTISRIIDSKPAELRIFLEEAAGISKYKERRRETETRIRHTRDNLARLNDVREELDKQLQHLRRQARNAEKYQLYRDEERRLKAEIVALRWRTLAAEMDQHEANLRRRETELEAQQAALVGLETRLLQQREQQTALGENVNQAQARHYELGAEIARREQSLDHQRQLQQRQDTELRHAQQALSQLQTEQQADQQRLQQVDAETAAAVQALAAGQVQETTSAEQLQQAEAAVQAWQSRWDSVTASAAVAQREADVERARIEQLERLQLQHQRTAERLEQELAGLNETALEHELGSLQQQLQLSTVELQDQQQALATSVTRHSELSARENKLSATLHSLRERLQAGQGRLAALQTLQEAALGQQQPQLKAWLAEQGLSNAPRLAQTLRVASGWEQAAEVALEHWLDAVCVTDLTATASASEKLRQGSLTLIETAAETDHPINSPAQRRSGADLADKIDGLTAPRQSLRGVQAVADLATALAQRGTLQAGESLVTPDGVWLGSDWLRLKRSDSAQESILARQREIRDLRDRLNQDETKLRDDNGLLVQTQNDLQALERQRAEQQERRHELQKSLAEQQAKSLSLKQRLGQQQERRASNSEQLSELRQALDGANLEIGSARQILEGALGAMAGLSTERASLEQQRESLRKQSSECRSQLEAARARVQQAQLSLGTLHNEKAALERALQRLNQQQQELSARRGQLDSTPVVDLEPIREQLETLLEQRLGSDAELTKARQVLAEHEADIRRLDNARSEQDQVIQQQREALQALRLSQGEAKVRRQTLQDQLTELGYDLETVLQELSAEATQPQWQEQLDSVANRIQRLGAINLAAIEECAQLEERKQYLDAQNDDLCTALETLETAMAKLDRETRERFRDTFNRVDEGLKNLFPRLFGGGQAYLELSGHDTLDAGVAVLAQPPGKRIGNIHLLSGGEKALTAVALVFAIFQLNPAPFCMLDEVDAPLDEANVGRFGRLLQELSEQVQFIIVTHNKATMEVAPHLAGVTMHEPGVSRLVAVDVDEAIRLAEV